MLENIQQVTLLFTAIGYLCGSIPFGLVWAKVFGLGDIRKIGSGNIGATNALRTGNKSMALLTLLSDIAKGALPIVVASQIYPGIPWLPHIVALAALIGHIFPIWLRFKGGKGVATSFGVLLALVPTVALAALFTWVLVAFLTRYSSLSALTTAALSPVYTIFLSEPGDVLVIAAMSVILWLTHRHNIYRLINRQEGKISFGRKE